MVETSDKAGLWLTLLIICLGLSSCGYHIAGKRLDAGKGLTIAVPTFTNRTTAYRIEQHISEAVRQELIRRTRFTVQPNETGDVVVKGDVKAINLSPVIFNQQGRGSSYTVIVDFNVNITDKRTNTVIFKNESWTFREVFELAQSSAEYVPEDGAALDRLSRRFASALVDSMLYAK
jgi:outer membrane lipopolysaccharide assembly protein LptE/RlpB